MRMNKLKNNSLNIYKEIEVFIKKHDDHDNLYDNQAFMHFS